MFLRNFLFGFMACCSLALANTKPNSLRWEGFNVGINFGGLINHTKADIKPAGNYLTPLYINSNGPRSDAWHFKNSGFTGGAQVGYNYQTSLFVLGLETDFNYSSLKRTHRFSRIITTEVGNPTFADVVGQRIDWFGTLRPRLGIGFKPVLFYITGGLAYGHIKSRTAICYRADDYLGSTKKVKHGWTAGGGVEIGFNSKWSAKFEYLYLDLGKVKYTNTNVPNTYPGFIFHTILENKFNCLRIGLNRLF